MNSIQVDVSTQIGGMTFSLAPSSRKQVKELFPNAFAVNSLFIAYDVKSEFEIHPGELLMHVCPALIGASEEEIFKRVEEIRFVDPVKNKTLETLKRPYPTMNG